MDKLNNELTPGATRAIRRADILMGELGKGMSLGMASWDGQADEQKVKESKKKISCYCKKCRIPSKLVC